VKGLAVLRNVEIKARLRDQAAARETARRMADGEPRLIPQTDTYFSVPVGRLKLRESGDSAELIYYVRGDEAGPRASDYDRVPVANPSELREVLTRALGVKAVVNKKRTLFMSGGVRIHVDEVRGLGAFLELEAVLTPDRPETDALETVKRMLSQFGVDASDLIPFSYCDLAATR